MNSAEANCRRSPNAESRTPPVPEPAELLTCPPTAFYHSKKASGPAKFPAVHMDAGLSPARQVRARHRHELRTLTYVTLDQANGGIVRNLSDRGIGVQVVAAVRPRQQLRVRFELRYPRLQIETRAEVIWATFSGQCGIRFLDMPATLTRHINQWIFGDLLEGISFHADSPGSIFAPPNGHKPQHVAGNGNGNGSIAAAEEEDGLLVSSTPVQVIELPRPPDPAPHICAQENTQDWIPPRSFGELDWLSQPLSGRTLAWTIDTLVVIAASLLFALVFLSVTREAPPWPLAVASGGCLIMTGMYWGFFRVFAGGSLGARLARLAEANAEDADDTRFR